VPVRKVSNRGGNIIGHFPSIKLKRMVAFESLIERDYLYLLDNEAGIEWFEEQPLTIEYWHESKTLHYTPDFHIVEAGKNVLIECKPFALVDRDENQRKFRAAHAWCIDQGWSFRIVSDHDIRTGFRLENVKLLTRYARHVIEPGIKGLIYASMHSAQVSMSVDDLVRRVASTDLSMTKTAILFMAFYHEICIALDNAPIQGSTHICLPSTQTNKVN